MQETYQLNKGIILAYLAYEYLMQMDSERYEISLKHANKNAYEMK